MACSVLRIMSNESLNLSAEQMSALRNLAGRARSQAGNISASQLLEQVSLSPAQIEELKNFAAAEGKIGEEFERLDAAHLFGMVIRREGIVHVLPTLTVDQIAELNKKLSTMRHDINNNLAMVMAAAELAKLKPDMAEKMLVRLLEQPTKISAQLKEYSAHFEKTLNIIRP